MNITSDEELAGRRAREAIERLLRPRGELLAEKQAVVQGLAKSLGQEQLSSPVFLIDSAKPVSFSDPTHEKHREFIEAVQNNIKLQNELSRLRAEHRATLTSAGTSVVSSTSAPTASSARAEAERRLLEEQLKCNKLGKERQKLEALDRYYEELGRQPAAAASFLDGNDMFKNCAPFPELPRELVEGFTKNQEAPDHEAQELVLRLRKATLRQKLVLEHDRRKLEGLKARDPVDPRDFLPEVQMAALNEVKNSLVNWIETMLSKAGEGETEDGGSHPNQNDGKGILDCDAQVADIEKEYKHHIELRKQIMASISQLHRLKELPQPLEQVRRTAPAAQLPILSRPETYLLTPYLEKLQALSREQKGYVQEKAHINATVARQQQETNKTLRSFTQDNKLLSNHAPPKTEKSGAGPSFAKATKSVPVAEQIQPWLFAADSAKIATLEAVAEAVDKGQASVGDAIELLDQVSMLQNKGPLQVPGGSEAGSPDEGAESIEDDTGGVVGKRADKKVAKDEQPKSIWSVLDGNLGLINQ